MTRRYGVVGTGARSQPPARIAELDLVGSRHVGHR